MHMHSELCLIQSRAQLCCDAMQQSKLVPSMAGGSCRTVEKVRPLYASQQGEGNNIGWGLIRGRAFWVPSVSWVTLGILKNSLRLLSPAF